MTTTLTPTTTAAPIIAMDEIRKIYDTGKIKVEALKGIDLTVQQGDFVAIVGPSGSGQSTLMNLIGCLDTPSEGPHRLGGEEEDRRTRSRPWAAIANPCVSRLAHLASSGQCRRTACLRLQPPRKRYPRRVICDARLRSSRLPRALRRGPSP